MAQGSAKRELVLKATAETFFEVVTDYERYPEFLTGMTDARILERNGDRVIAEFHVTFFQRYTYSLEMTHQLPHRVLWRQIKGPFQDIHGAWILQDDRGEEVFIVYEVELDIAFFVPTFITRLVLNQSFPSMLEEFRHRIEAHERAKRPDA